MTCRPVERLTSRSAEMPPYRTATRVMANRHLPCRGGGGGVNHDYLRLARRNADAVDFPFQRHAGRGEHAAAHFLAQPFEVGGGGAAGVDQEVAVLLRYLRAAAGQAAAAGGIDQLPGLHVGRIAERRTAGARAHRLRCLARGADFRHARRDRRGCAASRAQPGAHDDGAVRQARMAIGEGEIGRGRAGAARRCA